MAAITAITPVGETSGEIKVQWQDIYRKEKTVRYFVIDAVSDAQVVAFLKALDEMSSNILCRVWVNGVLQTVTGGKEAALDVVFSGVENIDNLTYFSAANCHDSLTIAVPGPLEELFTGVEKRLNDDNAGKLVALNTAYEAIAKNPKTGDEDFVYEFGERVNRPLVRPNIS